MNPEALVIITVGLGLGAVCKGATGIGLPLIALPILAASFGVPHAIAILALPVIAANGWQVWRYRSQWTVVAFLPRLLLGGILGIVAGTAILKATPPQAAVLALGVLLTGYIVFRLLRPNFALPLARGRQFAPSTGFAAGAMQGVTGICGPVLITFLHSLRLSRETFIFAISTIFLALSVTQLPALAVAGLIPWIALAESAFALLPVLLFMP
ncbi:MAG: sulfite exporter TauE/SafE family protein, partial [Hyphomicrobiales bacterium]